MAHEAVVVAGLTRRRWLGTSFKRVVLIHQTVLEEDYWSFLRVSGSTWSEGGMLLRRGKPFTSAGESPVENYQLKTGHISYSDGKYLPGDPEMGASSKYGINKPAQPIIAVPPPR